MATIVCHYCQRENEVVDDEVCPGYSDMYEALLTLVEGIDAGKEKIGFGRELRIREALAKAEG